MEDRQLVDVALQPVRQDDDDGEDHRRGADDRRPDEDRLRRRLECVARAVVLLEEVLRFLEVEVESEVPFHLLGDVRDALDERQLVDGLGVVCHGTV